MIKLADTLAPLADFPAAYAKDIEFDDGKNLQEKLNNGELGGGGGSHTHDNKTVLDSITAEKVEAWDKAEENVQSDWNETDDTADGFIKNKPTIPDITGLATEAYVDNKVADYTKTVDLADVAISGSYNDLADKPTIPDAYDDAEIRAELANKSDTDHTHTTVNGHTVESDVPVDAKFTDTVYDDTDIKAEIAKKADITSLPSKVSELENDSKYQTESDVTTTLADYATKIYVGEQIANAEHLKREIVTVLPSDTEASDNIIYMLKVESATGNDKYQEYMKIDGTVQMIGDTSVDLTDYAKSADIPTTVAELSDSGDYAKITDIQKKLDKTFTGTDVADKVLKTDSLGNVVLGTYDDTISDTSTNAVQNKVIKTELDKKFDIAQSVDKAGYVAVIGDDGNMTFTESTTLGGKAEVVAYTNDEYPELTNVDVALDKILAKIFYFAPEITNFTVTPNVDTYEIGTVLAPNTLTFSWGVNKDITSQALTDCTISIDDRSCSYDAELKSSKTFVLTVSDSENTATASKKISFLYPIYYGCCAEVEEYNNDFILALENKKLVTNNKSTYNFICGDGEFAYFATPTTMKISSAWVNGFQSDVEEVATVSHQNSSGHTSSYTISRFRNSGLGSFVAEVK